MSSLSNHRLVAPKLPPRWWVICLCRGIGMVCCPQVNELSSNHVWSGDKVLLMTILFGHSSPCFFFFTILPNFTTEFCEWWSSVRYVENALLYKVNFYFYLPKRLQTLTIHHGLKSWIIWTILTNNSSASHALKLLPQTTEIHDRTLNLPTSKEDTHPTTMRTRHYCSEYIPRYALSSGLVRKIPFERRIFMERRISCRTNGAFID